MRSSGLVLSVRAILSAFGSRATADTSQLVMAPLAAAAVAPAATAPARPWLAQRRAASSSAVAVPLHMSKLVKSTLARSTHHTLRTAATASSGGDGAGAPSGPRSSSLRQLKGVGPANELLLLQRQILRVEDLHRLYRQDCKGEASALAKFLVSEVGIRRQHSDMIAASMQRWAEEQGGGTGEAEGAGGAGGGAAGASGMVTLAVEGNISAGKSTFLDVLSHQHTALNDMLTVVQEPVQQWQEYTCKDWHGNPRKQNVLAKFYEDPNRYAYSFQHYVLISRMEADLKSRDTAKPLRVLERSIFSDRQVFVRAMHASGTMEDFEVSVYNQIFDDHLKTDLGLIPDGFVYLRASPDTCMHRLRKRSRSEEVGIDQGYLEMLHANHEDWLSTGTSLRELRQRIEPLMSVLSPAPEGAAERFAQGMPTGSSTDWTVQLLKGVPEAIKDQVVLLKGQEGLPQLRNRLALVMDHDRDVDMQRDEAAREEYAHKIKAFYSFVQEWKQAQLQAAQQTLDEGRVAQVLRHAEQTVRNHLVQQQMSEVLGLAALLPPEQYGQAAVTGRR
ncbi:hypothetical protein ABPG77_008802 [Micractinium sp. CCAP 211/92]